VVSCKVVTVLTSCHAAVFSDELSMCLKLGLNKVVTEREDWGLGTWAFWLCRGQPDSLVAAVTKLCLSP
jgi:hypothetical protein